MRQTRKPNRLADYDYAGPGAYFVTICTKDRKCLLSRIAVGATCGRPDMVELTKAGEAVKAELLKIPEIYGSIRVDSYVVMPNHVHAIFVMEENDGQSKRSPAISRVIQQMKGTVTKKLGQGIWQKGFYDHVIRDEQDYRIRRKYIEENPAKWALDEYHLL